MYNGLSSVADVLGTWWGLTLFIVADVLIFLLVVALNYKWLFKRVLDILFSAIFLVAFFPLFILALAVQAVYNARTNAYLTLFERRIVCGKKRIPVRYTLFSTCRVLHDADGKRLSEERCITAYGKVLRACGMQYYPALAAVFAGKLSFIGPRPMSLADSLAVKGEGEARFSVRPGLISSLERYGGSKLTYPDMFEEDAEYAARRGLFHDISFFMTKIAHRMRGDRAERIYGECASQSYLDWLGERGELTEEDAIFYRVEAERILQERKRRARERADFQNINYYR